MTVLKAVRFGLILSPLILFCGGCADDILDPTDLGRWRPVPVVNVILDSLGVADEPDPAYAETEEPTPEDLVEYERDYVFGPGDVIRVSIYELRQEGVPFINDYVVTESGRISIPDVGQIRAAGLTEVKLEEEIKNILSPGILKDPSVTVLLLQSEKRVFSIYGRGVGQSGRFPIPRYTFRLTDAIALAGDVGQFNVSYIYVSRDVPVTEEARPPVDSVPIYPEKPAVEREPVVEEKPSIETDLEDIRLEPVEPDETGKEPAIREDDLLELIKPYAGGVQNSGGITIAVAELATEKELRELEAAAAPPELEPDKDIAAGTDQTADGDKAISDTPGEGRFEWVFKDGRWVTRRIGDETTVAPPAVARPDTSLGPDALTLREPAAGEYGLGRVSRGNVRTRVIKIPIDRLKSGDPRYDIIIRPGDRISVPVDIIGEFWITGNVNNRGMIDLTGRPMTLKMAIAAAGGLGPLAWPKKVEVVRRIGRNRAGLMQEEIVMVDLDKIAKGLQPDFFIKPYDLINVGTHGTSRWLAVLRNAFRATYGFGFIYDRNFATRDFGNDPFPGHISFDSVF